MSGNNIEYFRLRADQELAAAEGAANEAIAAIHRQLAQRYLDLAGQSNRVDALSIMTQASR